MTSLLRQRGYKCQQSLRWYIQARLQHLHLYQTICGAEDDTRRAEAIQRRGAVFGARTIPR